MHGRLGLGGEDKAMLDAKGTLAPLDIEWVSRHVYMQTKNSSSVLSCTRAIGICAGYDSSMVVAESGQVLSFGRRSGRMGWVMYRKT